MVASYQAEDRHCQPRCLQRTCWKPWQLRSLLGASILEAGPSSRERNARALFDSARSRFVSIEVAGDSQGSDGVGKKQNGVICGRWLTKGSTSQLAGCEARGSCS